MCPWEDGELWIPSLKGCITFPSLPSCFILPLSSLADLPFEGELCVWGLVQSQRIKASHATCSWNVMLYSVLQAGGSKRWGGKVTLTADFHFQMDMCYKCAFKIFTPFYFTTMALEPGFEDEHKDAAAGFFCPGPRLSELAENFPSFFFFFFNKPQKESNTLTLNRTEAVYSSVVKDFACL